MGEGIRRYFVPQFFDVTFGGSACYFRGSLLSEIYDKLLIYCNHKLGTANKVSPRLSVVLASEVTAICK